MPMDRRSFLHTSATAFAAASAAAAAPEAAEGKMGEVYELRVYTLKPGKQAVLDGYLSKAFLPALKRYEIGPMGVFLDKSADPLKYYVLIVAPTAEQLVRLSGRLADDADYRKAASEYFGAPASDPVYARIESSLMVPIAGMPRLEKPDTARARLFNLRIYESHNERAGKKKIEMFNKGELSIFRRVGLTPVLFAETVAGSAMPNLTYLLVFPDEAGRKAAWDRFRADAEWKKLRAIPEYADKEIVSHITNLILTPTDYSQI
jgi:hypothetical protein